MDQINFKEYIGNLKESISQLFNAILAGYPDEMLSARLFRTNSRFTCLLDFFFGKNHCEKMYNYEYTRKSQHPHYNKNETT